MIKIYIIESRNVTKKFKNGVKALNNFDLKVKEGQIFSLLGPNGAGKSTLIKILTTYYKYNSGEINIFGTDLINNSKEIRKNIACVSQNISVDNHLSLKENIIFQSHLYKIDRKESNRRMNDLINILKLEKYIDFPTKTYSGGIKRRLDIAINMISNPKILFLDEPTTGMDIESRKILWDIILKINKNYNTTIFLTTHYLEEADHLSDEICIMKDGKNIIQSSPDSLKYLTKKRVIKIEFTDMKNLENFEDLNKILKLNLRYEKKQNILFISIQNGKNIFKDLNNLLLKKDIDFKGISIIKPTLEEAFIDIINKDKEVNNNV
ncbi:ABC-2 type transport system ATP-binding protein [Oceanotoga teriensis]|uniref:ABC-2 type transport system ATP-binding protein n=1 Tax=Oceanotoga teriensis TaxID=515440 RepID=A0AA45HIW8_9BACT|nr:ABC transporter ATP-binding protein [Oceanotoga teriensis]PWJ95381.1 ABC-2 type transport system ATP-binding protein [Oceanotoga teriensis]